MAHLIENSAITGKAEIAYANSTPWHGLGKNRARFVHHLERFAKLVVAKERRECAKLAAEVGYWGLVNEIEARGEQA